MARELQQIERLFTNLITTGATKFPSSRQRLEAPAELGVYVIFNSSGAAVHVGRTPRAKGGIAQRLKDHLYGRSSFTYYYLNGDGEKLRNKFSFKCLVVKNDRERVLLEHYATAHLCPKHLGVGRSVS